MSHENPNQFEPTPEESKQTAEGSGEKPELKNLTERLRLIIQTVSGKPNLKVTTEIDPLTRLQMLVQDGVDADKEWYWIELKNPQTGLPEGELVHIPRQILESNENIAKGKAAHEGGHSAISRFGNFIPNEVLQNPGFHQLMAAAEERPTDQVVRTRFEGAGSWLDEARSEASLEITNLREATADMGYLPKSAQLSSLIVYEPHMAEGQRDNYSPDVLETYEKIRRSVEGVENTLPKESAPEHEVLSKAKKRYQIVYSKIWPEFKKLFAQDNKKEQLRQMINDWLNQQEDKGNDKEKKGSEKQSEKQDQYQEGRQNPIDSLPEELKNEIRKAAKKAKEKQQNKKAESNKEKSPSEADSESEKDGSRKDAEEAKKEGVEGKPEETLEKGESSVEEKTEASGQNQEKSEPRNNKEESEGGEEEGEEDGDKTQKPQEENGGEKEGGEQEDENPIPMDELSQDLMNSLEAAFRSLPKETREKISKKAQETLKKLEDRITKELDGNLVKNKPETHEEFEKRQEKKREEMEREKARIETEEQELEKVERHLATLNENQDQYEKTYQEVREYDEALFQRLEAIFTPNTKRETILRSSGSKINLPAVFQWEAQKDSGLPTDNRIFESVHLPEKRDYAISLLVDLSESMSHDGKIEETFKGVVLMTEVLNRLGINFEILGFSENIILFKKFEEKLTDSVRRKMTTMIDEAYLKNPGGHNAGNTNLGPCLAHTSKRLEDQPNREKILIPMTDGDPDDEKLLTQAVANIERTTKQKIIGIGLGPKTGLVKKFFGASLPNINTKQLPEVLGNLLEDIILNPEKYRSPKA